MLNTKVNLHGTISEKSKMSGNLNSGIEKVYPSLENLAIVPSGEKQEFNHPNYYGYDNVTVEAIKMQEKNVIPTVEEQIVVPDSEYSGLSKITVAGDEDLIPKNIKEGINIFGVEGTAKTVGYEYAEFDPFKFMEVLDNDTENSEAKFILLLLKNGKNEYSLQKNQLFANCYKIKTSDGQQIEWGSGNKTIVFDETKDILNQEGRVVRYAIFYLSNKNINVYSKPTYITPYILSYYFKNCELIIAPRVLIHNDIPAKLLKYDDNSNYYVNGNSGAIGYYSRNLIEFELKTDNTGMKLENSFYYTYSLKKARINLKGITSISSLFYYTYNLKEVEFYNCPTEKISQSSTFNGNYTLEKMKCSPYLLVNNSTFFYNLNNLKELSGIDFQLYSGRIDDCFALTNIENIKNIANEFNVQNALNLTKKSLINILNALIDLTGQTTQNLKLGVNAQKLTEEEKAIAINKNWTIAT